MRSFVEIWRAIAGGRGLRQRGGNNGYRRIHRRGFEPLEPRLALASDVLDALSPKVDLDIRLFNPNGSEVTTLAPGDDFVLKVFATDIREEPLGMYAAYLDITWDASLAVTTGPLSHSPGFSNGKEGMVSAGLIDDAGGFAGSARTFGATIEVFSILMRATGTGTLVFTADPAEPTPMQDVLIHGENGNVDDQFILYGTATAQISGTGPGTVTFQTVADTFSAQEDSQGNVLTPLANDVGSAAAAGTLVIAEVGATSHGGTVSIAGDGKSLIYKPAANFTGRETVTYTAASASGERHTAAITVDVASVNDPPTTVDDHYAVGANSVHNQLPAHLNDSPDPDQGENIKIVGFGTGDQGGTITHEGDFLYYTPRPGFVGLETFRYTIGDTPFVGPDIVGLTAEGTITVEVGGFAAVPDQIEVVDYSAPAMIDVLANDSPGGRPKGELRIVSVTPPTPDVPISIAPDGKSLLYAGSPVPRNFSDISYIVSDGQGVFSSAMLSLIVGTDATALPGVTLENGVLQITGSLGDDRLVVSLSRGRLRVAGSLGGDAINETFAARGVRRIVANLGEGNDSLTVRPNVGAALRVDAGAGNDAVFAGLGAAVLVGGEGDDTLRGGAKRDVLIGGAGNDRILSGAANDLVIQGATAYDGDLAALDAILAEWGSKRSLAVRRANIQHGTGPILEGLDVSLDEGLLEEAPGAVVFHPLASRGR
jgi:hypothetical protein